MAGRIRQSDIDEVKARTNIADIVGEHVTPEVRRRRLDEGSLPLPRRAQPELPRAPAGRLLPLLRLRRGRRRLHVPAADGPRLVHRGGRAPRRPGRLRAALRGRRAAAPDHGNRARLLAAQPGGRRVLRRAARRRPRPTPAGASSASAGSTRTAAAQFGVGFAPKSWDALTRPPARPRGSRRGARRPPGWSRRATAASTTGSAAGWSGRSATSPARPSGSAPAGCSTTTRARST